MIGPVIRRLPFPEGSLTVADAFYCKSIHMKNFKGGPLNPLIFAFWCENIRRDSFVWFRFTHYTCR
jgi:hypothetical protein